MTIHPNIGTALLVCAIFAAFFAAQHMDMTDDPPAVAAALSDAQKQARKEAAAQYACGPQSAYEWVNESTVQCFTKRGRKAGELEVAAK